MNQAKRKTDVVVAVISEKDHHEKESIAVLYAKLINTVFENSHYSVIAVGESDKDKFFDLIEKCSIAIIDKSLKDDLHGNDGIKLLNILAPKYPHKRFMVMSSTYTPEDRSQLTTARFRLDKPLYVAPLKSAIEHCIRELELQYQIDSEVKH